MLLISCKKRYKLFESSSEHKFLTVSEIKFSFSLLVEILILEIKPNSLENVVAIFVKNAEILLNYLEHHMLKL